MLFRRALQIIDSAPREIFRPEAWSFGGGTVLMRRYRHRHSKDIDLFVPDPQYLGYVDPDLNADVEALAPKSVREAGSLKLYFDEGEIDFIVSPPLTRNPFVVEDVLGRRVQVETTIEILAKKIHYRAERFTSRDLFDFALVAQKEPAALVQLAPLMREKRDRILERIAAGDRPLRTTFAALEVLEYKASYDDCVDVVTKVLRNA